MYSNRWYRQQPGLLSLVAIVLLAACSDDPTLPKPVTSQPRVSFSATPGGGTLPPVQSNSIKYRDAGKKAGTGREGSSTLTARGLLARNGETLLEITTGELDAGSAPGNLDKIQIKTMDPNGNVLGVVNYNKLKNGGYASYGIMNLAPGSRIQVQSNVSGIDPTRTDVVTVLEAVKRRPDLTVLDVRVPARALPNVPVSIGATLQEVNGDVGARANCVLLVDGAEADRANGIWIDAASTVSCAFTQRFATSGTKRLRVVLESVRPDDWDPNNNAADATIDIANANDFYWSAYVVDNTIDYFYRDDWSWSYGPDNSGVTAGERGVNDYSQQGRYQGASQYASMNQEMAFPLDRMEFSQESNGALLLANSFDQVAADWTYSYSGTGSSYHQSCVLRVTELQQLDYGLVWHVYGQLCSGASGPTGSEYPWTDFHQYRFAGEVTYFSYSYYEQWWRDANGNCLFNCYAYNYGPYSGIETAGMPLPTLGPDYTMRAAITSGGRTFNATSVVPLSAFSYSSAQPYTCSSWINGLYSGHHCVEYRSVQSGVQGYATGVPDTP